MRTPHSGAPRWPGQADGTEAPPRTLAADLVVVGSGVAGLSAALAAVETAPGLEVVVVTPVSPGGDGATAMAQGGIAAALGPGDGPELHALDTLRASGGGALEDRVRILTEGGPARIQALLRLGARFDLDEEGRLALGLEGAHARRRIVHARGDRTGEEVAAVLARAAEAHPRIRVLTGLRAVGLLQGGLERLAGAALPGRVIPGPPSVRPHAAGGHGAPVTGVILEEMGGSARRTRSPGAPPWSRGDGTETGDWGAPRRTHLHAPRVLLATGGAAGLFLRSTASPFARGDGLAMALAAGARLHGMEFTQFHPTALDVEAEPLPLVTEALRGEGAELVDERGHSLFPAVAGGAGALASRDQVARRIWAEMAEGGKVFLDARRAVGTAFPHRFPGVHARCLEFGIDPVRDRIPVTPAAHYQMGGIAVDAEGRSSVPGLLAAGEVAWAGVHGANRLASNSLLEGLVYGDRAGRAAAREIASGTPPAAGVPALPASAPHPLRPADPGGATTAALEGELRTLLWEGAGVVREEAGLRRALGGIESIEARAAGAGASTWGVMAGPLAVARSMVEAALARKDSLGSHFRLDAPPEGAVRAPPAGTGFEAAPQASSNGTQSPAASSAGCRPGDPRPPLRRVS